MLNTSEGAVRSKETRMCCRSKSREQIQAVQGEEDWQGIQDDCPEELYQLFVGPLPGGTGQDQDFG